MSSPGLPTIVTSAGMTPRSPAALRAALLASVAATNPDYTANLPGSLIDDVSGTEVAGIALCDAARVETVDSISPYGANAFLLNQQGQMFGIPIGEATNTSVYLVFTSDPGYVVAQGFTVSDGTYQYRVVDGGIVAASGQTSPLFAVATIQGSWSVPSGTVTELVTSIPSTVTLSVTNPQPGLPGVVSGETEESYRARLLTANLAASQGMARYLKTLVAKVSGVQPRLVSVRAVTGGWEVIVGGGDPYEVAYAIWTALFDTSTLVGSTTRITGITKANPGVVTTDLNHGLITGQTGVAIAGVLGMTAANGGPYTVTVLTAKTFSFGVDTSAFGVYTSGGIVTPNTRGVTVTISDPPNAFPITFVVPPQQVVTMTVTWNTSSTNFVSSAAVAQLGAPALAAYVSSIEVGAPINLFELQSTFQLAIAPILDPDLLTRMAFAVSINGVSTAPSAGTGIIAGDPESYFSCDATGVNVTQG